MEDFIQKFIIYRFDLSHTIIIAMVDNLTTKILESFVRNFILRINSRQSAIHNQMVRWKKIIR